MNSNDYRGQPVNIRQGRKFEEWPCKGFTCIRPLTFLHGRKWDDIALAYVHALRPTHLRVVQGGYQCDAQVWRVTVMLKEDGETIEEIHQEVEVGLPDGIEHGHDLDCAFRAGGGGAELGDEDGESSDGSGSATDGSELRAPERKL